MPLLDWVALVIALVIISGVVFTWPGCAPADDEPTGPAACREFVDVLCARSVECNFQGYPACVAEQERALDCPGVVRVAESFDRCLDAIPAASCASLRQSLPGACLGVLQVAR